MGQQRPTGIYTETLARLYQQQGHLDKALAIYRHLAQVYPDNAVLVEHIVALEHQLIAGPPLCDERALPGKGEASTPTRAGTQAQRLLVHLERWLAVVQSRRQEGADMAHPSPHA